MLVRSRETVIAQRAFGPAPGQCHLGAPVGRICGQETVNGRSLLPRMWRTAPVPGHSLRLAATTRSRFASSWSSEARVGATSPTQLEGRTGQDDLGERAGLNPRGPRTDQVRLTPPGYLLTVSIWLRTTPTQATLNQVLLVVSLTVAW